MAPNDSGAWEMLLRTQFEAEDFDGAAKSLDLRGIHWVIVNGESGPHARTMTSNGLGKSSVNAENKKFHFSSNNGAAFERIWLGACSADELTTRCRTGWRRKQLK